MRKTLSALIIVILGIFGYVSYSQKKFENDVIEHVTTEKNISKDDIISNEFFIANLAGEKNYMISVKIKNDTNTYFYYKNKNNKITLESYTTKDGEEHIVDQ